MLNIESIEFDDEVNQPGSLRPRELEAVYAISQAIATAADPDEILDKIIRVIRPVFIFDNLVLFEGSDQSTLEPTFARAIGRGRAREADLAWGEATSLDVYEKGGSSYGKKTLGTLRLTVSTCVIPSGCLSKSARKFRAPWFLFALADQNLPPTKSIFQNSWLFM